MILYREKDDVIVEVKAHSGNKVVINDPFNGLLILIKDENNNYVSTETGQGYYTSSGLAAEEALRKMKNNIKAKLRKQNDVVILAKILKILTKGDVL